MDLRYEQVVLFRILGPVEVGAAGSVVSITPGRQQALLASLLLGAGAVVPVEQLVEAVWAGAAPTNARNQIHKCIHQLRRRLTRISDRLLVTEADGYRVAVDAQNMDMLAFRRLAAAARAALEQQPQRARELFRTALALRRGPALAGIHSDLLRQAASTLDDEVTEVVVESARLELALGGGGRLVGELTALARRHPYREDIHSSLILALDRAGRRTDALASYRRVRQLFRDELGIEPGEELRQLHRAILVADPRLSARRSRLRLADTLGRAPRQLPPDVAEFTGRAEPLRQLDQLLSRRPATGPVPIVAITGRAGVGKTGLAVHWAHRAASRFPDGQLYLNLRGYADAAPRALLAALLRSLGAPAGRIPDEQAQAASELRSRLADQRVLVLLDGADSADQIRPLLPGTPGCLVLVTSRHRLSPLVACDGARRLELGALEAEQAHDLLARLLGADGIDADPAAIAELARACGYLPLLLRLAVADVADHPTRSVQAYLAGHRVATRRARPVRPGCGEAAPLYSRPRALGP